LITHIYASVFLVDVLFIETKPGKKRRKPGRKKSRETHNGLAAKRRDDQLSKAHKRKLVRLSRWLCALP